MSSAKPLYLPVLLDRLTDDEPDERTERLRSALTRSEYHARVVRDLSWLLNATQLDADSQASLPDRVRRSTLNFGVPALSGRRFSELDLPGVAATIHEAILAFEPRIMADSLRVTPLSDPVLASHNQAVIEIAAKLWFEPAPIDFLVRTELDMEAGHARVSAA